MRSNRIDEALYGKKYSSLAVQESCSTVTNSTAETSEPRIVLGTEETLKRYGIFDATFVNSSLYLRQGNDSKALLKPVGGSKSILFLNDGSKTFPVIDLNAKIGDGVIQIDFTAKDGQLLGSATVSSVGENVFVPNIPDDSVLRPGWEVRWKNCIDKKMEGVGPIEGVWQTLTGHTAAYAADCALKAWGLW